MQLSKLFNRCLSNRAINFYQSLIAFFPNGSPTTSVLASRRRVGIASGFGYGNLGDEAQLAFNIERWASKVPIYNLVAFSPNPAFSEEYHQVRAVDASRSCVFGAGSSCGSWLFPRSLFKLVFLFSLFRLTISAAFLRAGLNPFLLSSKETEYLLNLNSLQCLHISGGGFITGKTYTRMLDTTLQMLLCQSLRIPYFLTGHTIGLVEGRVEKYFLRKALNGARLVSLRDGGLSERELIQLGVQKELLINSIDDATFCASSLDSSHYNDFNKLPPNYFIVNYHWWGMSDSVRKSSAKTVVGLINKSICSTGATPIGVAMHPSDIAALEHLKTLCPDLLVIRYLNRHDSVRHIISNSKFILSLKHHPIVFALGENVPVMALSFDNYYHRKNEGVLLNYNQEAFLLKLPDDEDCFERLDGFLQKLPEIRAGLKAINVELKEDQSSVFSKALELI